MKSSSKTTLSRPLKSVLGGVLTLALMTIFYFSLEKAEVKGHTDESPVLGENYGVFRQSKRIVVATSLLPASIMKIDGKLVRMDTAFARGRQPLRINQPASEGEAALWRQYFE